MLYYRNAMGSVYGFSRVLLLIPYTGDEKSRLNDIKVAKQTVAIMRKEEIVMKADKIKKVFSTVLLIGTAVGAAINVFTEDRKDKEFEALKKTVEELKAGK